MQIIFLLLFLFLLIFFRLTMTPVKSPAAKRLGFSYSPHKIPLPVSTHKTYHMSKKDDALNGAMKHFKSSKYRTGLKTLYKCIPAARKAIVKMFTAIIKKEVIYIHIANLILKIN